MSLLSPRSCTPSTEDFFGPFTSNDCLDGFDFTLLFEESILTILPCGLAVVWACLRLLCLRRHPSIARNGILLPLKLGAYATAAALQISLLVVWVRSTSTIKTQLTYPTIAFNLGCTLFLGLVSYLEHVRSARPSTFLILYLGLTLLLDLPRVRTLWFLPGDDILAPLSAAAALLKGVILLLELREKRHLIQAESADPSPEATASIVSIAFLAWVNPLFWLGLRETLSVDTLLPLDADILNASRDSSLLQDWSIDQRPDRHKDALLFSFIYHFRWTILAGVVPRLLRTAFLFAQPFLVQRVLSFDPGQDVPNQRQIGYSLVGAYALVYIGIALVSALYEYFTNRVLAKFRGGLVSLIGRKNLRISPSQASDAEAITLMSADIDRIGIGVRLMHEGYASVIELGLSLWLLFDIIGVATAASTVWLIVALSIGIPIAIGAGNAQIPWLEAIEERLAITAKALTQIVPIKMSGLARPISSRIASIREQEIRASLRYRFMMVLMTSASFLSQSLTPVVGLGAFILIARMHGNYTLTPDVAFAALTLFDLQQQPANFLLTMFEDFQIVASCFRRIQQYLLLAELENHHFTPVSGKILPDLSSGSPAGSTGEGYDLTVKQEKDSGHHELSTAVKLDNVSMKYSDNGKSIFEDLTHKIPIAKKTVILGPVACGKSTLMKLILRELQPTTGSVACSFPTVAYCAQTAWIMAGSIRSNIVGMSGWDSLWYERVVAACALRQDFDELPKGDLCITGPGGSRLSGGQKMRVTLARAIYSRLPMLLLDSVLTGLDSTTEKHIIESIFGTNGILAGSDTTVVFATSSDHHAEFADHVIRLNEPAQDTDQLPGQKTDIVRPRDPEKADSITSDHESVASRTENRIDHEAELFESIPEEEPSTSRRTSDFRVYSFYLRAVGIRLVIVYLLTCAVYVAASVFPSVWVQYWTNSNEITPNNRIGYWLGIYAAIGVLTIVTSILSEALFMLVVVPKTSRRFHEHLLSTTIRATMSFLTSTDSGKTVNRFSQDLELIDNDLPQSFDLFVLELMSTISSTVLIFVGSSYVAAAIPVCIAVLYLIQKFYLRTSRQLRLLDIEAKAPLFSHFLETLHGAPSIRAYNWTDQFLDRYLKSLDNSQRPYYLMGCIQLWLTLVLDLLVAGLAILLVGLATNLSNGASSFLGVALLNIVNFSTTLQGLVQQWISLETAIGAVSRVRAYVQDTAPEDRDDDPQPVPDDWPAHGALSLQHVYASFTSSDDAVLQEITLDIRAGEKLAVCGRTGSGKSSLLATILSLLHIKAGSIAIDGVQATRVDRQVLRERIGTLPQDGVLMHGSVRDNLDPCSLASSDDDMVDALRKLQLWDVFEEQGGLDAELAEGSLSHGQRQLFCMARAVVKRSRILLLDEATSSVDAELDRVMAEVIGEKFRDCTVIAVAHKLQPVLEFDRVVVVEAGRIVECGVPKQLLEEPRSAFRALYEAAGDSKGSA